MYFIVFYEEGNHIYEKNCLNTLNNPSKNLITMSQIRCNNVTSPGDFVLVVVVVVVVVVLVVGASVDISLYFCLKQN